MKAALEQG